MLKIKSNLFANTSIILLLISSCSNVVTNTNNIESTATIQIPTNTATSRPTLALTKRVPTLTPSPPESILKFQPFEIMVELPSDAKPTGALLVSGDITQLVHFDSEVRAETLPKVEFDFCLSTSPDGKWLAYCPSPDGTSPTELIIESADGKQQNKIPVASRFMYNDHPWLDNQHLVFPLAQEEHRPQATYPMLVIDPFTKKQVKLIANYPDLWLSPSGTQYSADFGSVDVVYDPSLNLVIYPSAIKGSYIVLWDRQAKSTLAKIETAFGYYPLWSPDATQFVVPLLIPEKSDYGSLVEEWFRVTKNGQVEQLTHFEDYFTRSEINSAYNWSPDGQKLAFWLEVNSSLCSGQNLAIMDISTKHVTDTCITSDSPRLPVWSLDSRYIAVSAFHGDLFQLILVDSKQSQAFDLTALTGRAGPIGWMVSP